jgi:secreted PhoX family phosphatase
VTRRAWNPRDRAANRNLLDDGTLYAARFNDDGTLDWLPLVHGHGPLTAANGFASQAEVLINTRRAADLLGATPMDAPEGYEPNPLTGRVYIALTGGVKRPPGRQNAANPRVGNRHGHIIELVPPDRDGKPDATADRFRWEFFVMCGDPGNPRDEARFHPATSNDGWFVEPDNLGFDPRGRLWVCSDGPGPKLHDGLWAMDTEGPGRALPKLFYSPPNGSECCSPAFTPDGRNLFLSVQHPSERSPSQSTVLTRWPDFRSGVPPRPSVIVITRDDGGSIGD